MVGKRQEETLCAQVSELLATPSSGRVPAMEGILRAKMKKDAKQLASYEGEPEQGFLPGMPIIGRAKTYRDLQTDYEAAKTLQKLPEMEEDFGAQLERIAEEHSSFRMDDAYSLMDRLARSDGGMSLQRTYRHVAGVALQEVKKQQNPSPADTEILNFENPSYREVWYTQRYPFKALEGKGLGAKRAIYSIGSLAASGIRSCYFGEDGEVIAAFKAGVQAYFDDCGPDLRLMKTYFDAIETYVASQEIDLGAVGDVKPLHRRFPGVRG